MFPCLLKGQKPPDEIRQSWRGATLLPYVHAVRGLMMSTVICYQTTGSHAKGFIPDLNKRLFTKSWALRRALRRAVDSVLGTSWLGGVSLEETYDGNCTNPLTT